MSYEENEAHEHPTWCVALVVTKHILFCPRSWVSVISALLFMWRIRSISNPHAFIVNKSSGSVTLIYFNEVQFLDVLFHGTALMSRTYSDEGDESKDIAFGSIKSIKETLRAMF